jgi:hypothetical protein
MNVLPSKLHIFSNPNSEARVELEARLGPRSFAQFFRMAWPYIDPAHLLWNWHIDLLCSEMEAAARRKYRELVVCVPPRSLKSQILSVAFPAWVWTWNPAAKFITSSNEMTLATRDAVKTRRLVESEWYQRRWGPQSRYLGRLSDGKPHPGVQLAGDQNNKTYYETTAGGHRFCCTPGSNVTGHGADFILCLPADQLVLTDLGLQPIEVVVRERAASQILAFDHDTGQAVFRRILDFETHPARDLVEIETEDGQVLRCTLDHPVWVEGRGYIPAGDVRPDDVVLTCPDAFSV